MKVDERSKFIAQARILNKRKRGHFKTQGHTSSTFQLQSAMSNKAAQRANKRIAQGNTLGWEQ